MVNRVFVRRVLSATGWAVAEAINGEETIAVANARVPDLVIMDIGMPRGDGAHATRMIRGGPAPLASVPILAYTMMRLDDAEIRALGMDGRVPKPCTPEVLAAAAAHWRPDCETAGAHRLAEVFGVAELASLVARFRAQLADAVVKLDAGDVTAAHRIAGVAGTLGFAAVSASWVAVSEGDVASRDQARRDARIAIAQIDRDSPGGGVPDVAS